MPGYFISLHAESFDGKYVLIEGADSQYSYKDKIEVIEIFWYGCPHCYTMERFVSEWLKEKPDDVAFIRVPAVTNEKWLPLAKTFFTARKLGVLKDLHRQLYDAIHKEKRALNTDAEIRVFMEENGVDGDAFMNVYNSNEINLVLKEIYEFTINYRIASVPAFIINNKYITAPSLVGTYNEVMDVVDYLIRQEKKASIYTSQMN